MRMTERIQCLIYRCPCDSTENSNEYNMNLLSNWLLTSRIHVILNMYRVGGEHVCNRYNAVMPRRDRSAPTQSNRNLLSLYWARRRIQSFLAANILLWRIYGKLRCAVLMGKWMRIMPASNCSIRSKKLTNSLDWNSTFVPFICIIKKFPDFSDNNENPSHKKAFRKQCHFTAVIRIRHYQPKHETHAQQLCRACQMSTRETSLT